ncbi:hypothetical protein [Sinosporangium siamense]|uniref:Uncharacterized protein n=1 Tax=Sinosporangium siamense TaxID=1367973 RepID=A0A919RGB9_9ACTN|nr:hypothetical protein [Sinosporangium siamense]GII93217.1 hypothetical protein Ssi02_34480 [Sinosporangium siamense]
MRVYPRGYRDGYGEELIGTLLDTAEPGRTFPSFREAVALVRGGLRARAEYAAVGIPWADGLHLGTLILAVANFAYLAPFFRELPLWVGMSAFLVLAVMRGWLWTALPFAALIGFKSGSIALGVPLLDQTLVPVIADDLWDRPAMYGMGGPVAPLITYAVLFLGIAVLAARKRRVKVRSWWWWATVPALSFSDPAWLDVAGRSAGTMSRIVLETALLLMAVFAGYIAKDPRWAVAAAIYLVSMLAVLAEITVENIVTYTPQDVAHWLLLFFLTVAAAAVPYQARRQVLL